MNNDQMISIWKRKDKIKQKILKNKKAFKALQTSIQRDERRLHAIICMGKAEMHHGQLLDVDRKDIPSYGKTVDIRALADDNQRYSNIYLNQVNKKTYGAHLKVYNGADIWLGAYWEDLDEVLEVCIKYVALGIIPEFFRIIKCQGME